ncbi:MAG: hypothetical protein ACKVX9_06150 [Blastocatellia bacterium]
METTTHRSYKIPRRALLIAGLALLFAAILLLVMTPQPVAAVDRARSLNGTDMNEEAVIIRDDP